MLRTVKAKLGTFLLKSHHQIGLGYTFSFSLPIMLDSLLLEWLRLDVRLVSLSHNIGLHRTAAAPLQEECLNLLAPELLFF